MGGEGSGNVVRVVVQATGRFRPRRPHVVVVVVWMLLLQLLLRL